MAATESGVKAVFIAAIAGLVIFSVTTFYTDFLKQPNIDIMLPGRGHNDSKSFATINITNDGGESANNLKVTVRSNNGITVSDPAFYTENVTAGEYKSDTWWTTTVQRLAPRSAISSDVALNSTQGGAYLDIFATYDQGSNSKGFTLNEQGQFYNSSTVSSLNVIPPVVSIVGAGVAYLIARVYFRIKNKTVIRYHRLLNKLAHDMAIVVLYVEGKEGVFHETLSGKLFSLSYWRRESEDAKLNMFRRNEGIGNKVYNRAEDFFQAIENRDNYMKNKPHLEETNLEIKDDAVTKEELDLRVTAEIKHLNLYLVYFVHSFFTMNNRTIKKTGRSVKIYKNKGTEEIVTLGNEPKTNEKRKPKINEKSLYNDVFFYQYKCHLAIEVLSNIRWKGWLMLFLIFSGSYIIFLLLVYQPDIWSHISKLV